MSTPDATSSKPVAVAVPTSKRARSERISCLLRIQETAKARRREEKREGAPYRFFFAASFAPSRLRGLFHLPTLPRRIRDDVQHVPETAAGVNQFGRLGVLQLLAQVADVTG